MNYQLYLEKLNNWVFGEGMKIIIILIIAWIIVRVGRIIISRAIKTFIRATGKVRGAVQEQRVKTLVKVFKSTFSIFIWTMTFLTVLSEMGVNIAPLLAGAGLAGLAIGMGAKNLIQDFLSGLFILLEDQYRVGEEVSINGIKGEVIDLHLRRTIIKDSEETMHYILNGQINIASNFSRK